MSPTSRWSRNWTPFTTRPSRTSRQGMILAAGIQSLREPEALLPERLADDGARRADPVERDEVVERGDPARGLDGEMGEAGDGLSEQIEVRAGQHAVAA